MAKVFLISGALFSFLFVALGAFGAHALNNVLDTYGKMIWEKAVLYHMIHALALLITGILQIQFNQMNLRFTGYAFVAGIILFSGSLYLLAVMHLSWLGMITPFGGLSFLAGWGSLVYGLTRI